MISEERIESVYGVSAFKKLFDEDEYNELDEKPLKHKHSWIKWQNMKRERPCKKPLLMR